jgi:hypothetical protein
MSLVVPTAARALVVICSVRSPDGGAHEPAETRHPIIHRRTGSGAPEDERATKGTEVPDENPLALPRAASRDGPLPGA